jgi:hypothetical protein
MPGVSPHSLATRHETPVNDFWDRAGQLRRYPEAMQQMIDR